MKKEVRKISTLTLFNLDPEVVFHTNDVTLNSSIVDENDVVDLLAMAFQYSLQMIF
jgi:hypothetical protein